MIKKKFIIASPVFLDFQGGKDKPSQKSGYILNPSLFYDNLLMARTFIEELFKVPLINLPVCTYSPPQEVIIELALEEDNYYTPIMLHLYKAFPVKIHLAQVPIGHNVDNLTGYWAQHPICPADDTMKKLAEDINNFLANKEVFPTTNVAEVIHINMKGHQQTFFSTAYRRIPSSSFENQAPECEASSFIGNKSF